MRHLQTLLSRRKLGLRNVVVHLSDVRLFLGDDLPVVKGLHPLTLLPGIVESGLGLLDRLFGLANILRPCPGLKLRILGPCLSHLGLDLPDLLEEFGPVDLGDHLSLPHGVSNLHGDLFEIPRHLREEIDLHQRGNVSVGNKRIRKVLMDHRRNLNRDLSTTETLRSGPLLSGSPPPIEDQAPDADQGDQE